MNMDEFDLMYEDELELMNELHNEVNIVSPKPSTSAGANLQILEIENEQQENQKQSESKNAPVNRKLFAEATEPIPLEPFDNEEIHQNQNEENTNVNCFEEISKIGRNRKRPFKDLYGIMTGDFDDFNIDKEAKKRKNDEQKKLYMIEQILEARRKRKEAQNPLKKDNVAKLNALHDFKMRNLSHQVPNYSFIPLVRSNGDRIYVRFHSEQFETIKLNEINFTYKKSGSLFGDSKEEIWNQVREMAVKRLTHENTNPDTIEIALENDVLWTEKYKPRKYIDLLSDERTNRNLLSWLKMWDKIVFGKEFKMQEVKTNQLNTFNKRTKRFESNGGWNKRSKPSLNIDKDEYGRPMQKVALLCGPPGLGKTTLAHTIARHAGYSVRELNASDDRNLESFRLTLENGTQMTSVLNEDKRPNCIILDEIDGAPLTTIDFLVRFVSDKVVEKVKKGNKSKKHILRRPIICICNDLYVPALRQLRQIAFVINFKGIESSRLAERLLAISKMEQLKTDLGTLLVLAEKSGNDIRSCISIMQFYNSKKKKLTLDDVLNSKVGQKDRHNGLFEIWTAIFQIQRYRKGVVESIDCFSQESNTFIKTNDMSIPTRVKNILELVHIGGDSERLIQGVYENYLSQKIPDTNMNGIVQASEWFCFTDEIHNMIHHLQNYAIYPYLQYGFVAWHLLFGGLAWPKINFPNKGYEFNQKLKTSKMIFNALVKGIKPGIVGIGHGNAILIETIPILKRIFSPNLRSVSLQLLTPKERSDLFHVVNVMADMGLNYIQIKTNDGKTYQYQLEPDINLLCQFTDFQNNINQNYFAKQLIAREIELEQMRRSVSKSHKQNDNEKLNKKKIDLFKNDNRTVKNVEKNVIPNHLRNLEPKAIRSAETKQTVSKDFFGRVTTKQVALTVKEGGKDDIVKSPIWYRYKEGFNNAVRKDVLMSDLL